MLANHSAVTDKNTRVNFNMLFNHINSYYLGSLSAKEIDNINTNDLHCGALLYDSTDHCLKVLTQQGGEKIWKSLIVA